MRIDFNVFCYQSSICEYFRQNNQIGIKVSNLQKTSPKRQLQMIKLWKDFLFPNKLDVRNIKDIEELEKMSKEEMEKRESFILKFKGVSVRSLPQFHSPQLKTFILQNNRLKDIHNFALTKHQNLRTYSVTLHKQLRQIHLVEAQKLQKLIIKQNKQAILLNVQRLSCYSELKQAQIEQVTFYSEFTEEELIQLDQQTQIKSKIKVNENAFSQEKQIEQLKQTSQLDLDENKDQFNWEGQKKQETKEQYSSKVLIRYNQIDFLPRFSLDNVRQLVCLRNKIKSINWFSKGTYPNLRVLNLSDNLIQVLPKLDIPSVTQLIITGNKILQVGQFFSSVYPSLLNLNLSKNRIKEITLIDCPCLRDLNLCNNQLKRVPYLKTPNLQVLLLNCNSLIDDSELENNKIQLKHLQMQYNQLTKVPTINPLRIEYINLSYNFIVNLDNLAHAQFPLIKKLQIVSQNYSLPQKNQFKVSLPHLKMPLLETLDFKLTHIDEFSQFFQGKYLKLTYLDIGTTQTLRKLPKLSIPNIQTFHLNGTAIEDILQFSQGHYPKLIDFTWPKNLLLFKGTSLESNLQQVTVTNKMNQHIAMTSFPSDSIFYQKSLKSNIIHLKIDFLLIKSTQFLSFLNLSSTKRIYLHNCHFGNGLYQNLAKINWEELSELSYIEVGNAQKLNIIQFPYMSNEYSVGIRQLRISNDNKWRRFYRESKSIEWRNYGKKYQSFGYTSFMYCLGGSHKEILRYCKDMNIRNNIKTRHRRPRLEQAYK